MFDPTLVHEFLRFSTEKYPDKEALICGDQRYTYRELNTLSDNMAQNLINHGLQRHERVIVFLDNSAETVIALFAILKAGAAFVIVNGALKAAKLSYIARDSGSTFLISHSSKLKVVAEANRDIPEDCQLVWIGAQNKLDEELQAKSLFWDDLLISPQAQLSYPRIIDSDLATLIYTSGSTGDPKGVISSHHNMISAARSIIQYIENRPEDIIIDTLPLSFDYGLYQVIMSVLFGGTVVIEQSFMFPIKILQTIEKEKVTGFPIVPTIVAFLLNMPSFATFNLSSLKYMSNTGSALPVNHIQKLKELFPQVRMYSMYGLTECKRVSYLPPEDLEKKPGSVGIPMPNCEVFIVDEDGHELPAGENGELVIRGSNVMRGYWNSPELTAKTYSKGKLPGEKLLYSGDIFKKDEDGYLYFVGRKDDLIKTKGERVSPKEIENILCHHSSVADAAVIGVPDEILGSAIKAFVVPKSQNSLSEKDILKHCKENMEIFMVPKYVTFIDELPKTPNGKIDKKFLKTSSLEAVT
jgi:amino acid adenylation domain-containing protein